MDEMTCPPDSYRLKAKADRESAPRLSDDHLMRSSSIGPERIFDFVRRTKPPTETIPSTENRAIPSAERERLAFKNLNTSELIRRV
jgi:hypothetical protein